MNTQSKFLLNFILLFFMLVYFSAQSTLKANSIDEIGYGPSNTQTEAQEKISKIFNNLETTGNALNSGGSSAAALSLLDSGCRNALDYLMQTHLFNEIKDDITPDINQEAVIPRYLTGKLNGLGVGNISQLCAAARGEDINSPNIGSMLQKGLHKDILRDVILYGKDYVGERGFPFLQNLEIEMGSSDRSLIGSITSIQPLWQDENDLHHLFAQLSWHKAPDSLNEEGVKDKYDTYNAGMAYRYLTVDKKYLYGANLFFDYAPLKDHTRMSLGVDARTSQLALSLNRYMPLSNWRSSSTYYEERASAGWDAELRGQIPELPSWTAITKIYKWDAYTEGEKLYGAQASLEYSPVPAMTARLGIRDESEGTASLEAALRFNYRFDQPQDIQFRPRTQLASVAEHVYEKVHRDNIIRVKQQRKASTKLTVIQTSGVNTAQDSTGTNSLFVGQTLLMPVTVTTQNAVGAFARLRLSDGSTLTLGQNTQVLIEPTLITLISGSIQYVSNGIIQNIVVPGGTITLRGTDLDVVSTGATSSSVRLRDGGLTFTGSSSGSADLTPQDLVPSVNGVVGTALPTNNATYISHTDLISSQIERVAPILTGPKVAPYPFKAPRAVAADVTVGQQIVIGLEFNSPVTISGGTPQMNFTINGFSRIANYTSGSGTNDLLFTYTVQAGDLGATTLTVNGLNQNGATIMGNGKDAVFTIADSLVSLTSIGGGPDVTPPSGYTALFTTDPVNDTNKAAISFQFAAAEIGSTYNYSISSSGGGTPVTGSGTISSLSQTISGIDVSGLNDGTLTLSVTLTDSDSNIGVAATDTVIKDAALPSSYTAVFTTDPVNLANYTTGAFQFAAAEVGSTYNYTISSSGGGTNVTGTGTIATITDTISAINLTSLNDGTLTLSVTLTDTSGNVGVAATDTVVKDIVAPTITSITFTNGTYEP
jgi:Inverse autotransporter, beta-domain